MHAGRLAACGATTALLLAACGGTATRMALSPASGYRLLLRTPAGLELVDSDSGAVRMRVPDGAIPPDLRRVYTVVGTVLEARDLRSGAVVAQEPVAPAMQVPRSGAAHRPTGLSPDGSRLVLADAVAPALDDAHAVSHFLVLRTTLAAPAVTVTLPGAFAFDGISDDGHNLYLLQWTTFPSGRRGYHVRRYDLQADVLDPIYVVAKNAPTEQMSGVELDRTWSADGVWQYTAYAYGDGGLPFVHALRLDGIGALCIGLPPTGDPATDLGWALVRSPDGSKVYAVNGAAGWAVRIDAASANVEAVGTLTASPAAAGLPGPGATPPPARRLPAGGAVLLPDGRTVLAVAEYGLAGFDTHTLVAALGFEPAAGTDPLSSVALSPDGRRLFATIDGESRQGGLIEVDVRTGATVARVPVTDAAQQVVAVEASG